MSKITRPESPIRRAAQICGSPSALARHLGIKPPSVFEWIASGRVPPARCIEIEVATGGEVTRYELRPDVFGEREVA